MFGRSYVLAAAASALMLGCAPAAPAFANSPAIARPAIVPAPAHRLRSDRKTAQRRAAQGRTYKRGDKLGRRLRRNAELGRWGAF